MPDAPRLILLTFAGAALLSGAGCGKRAPAPDHAHESGHGHAHAAPHGGTLVVLGDEAWHLEFVLETATGRLQAYVLGAHAEQFVRVAQPALEVEVVRGGQRTAVSLPAVADPATGETVGDTALFATDVPALLGADRFDGTVKSVTVRGSTFTSVAFRYPEGNESH